MDLVLNNLQRLIYHKTQPTNQSYIHVNGCNTIIIHKIYKLQLQIIEALHMKTKNLELIELTLKIATMF